MHSIAATKLNAPLLSFLKPNAPFWLYIGGGGVEMVVWCVGWWRGWRWWCGASTAGRGVEIEMMVARDVEVLAVVDGDMARMMMTTAADGRRGFRWWTEVSQRW
nr:hypothetical protein [Tanacetum cinerariifolium]